MNLKHTRKYRLYEKVIVKHDGAWKVLPGGSGPVSVIYLILRMAHGEIPPILTTLPYLPLAPRRLKPGEIKPQLWVGSQWQP